MELLCALGAVAEPPSDGQEALVTALELGESPSPVEHTELFALQLVPYASPYLGSEGVIGGEARARVAGFWRALGLEPPKEPDHLTVLLSFYSALAQAEQQATGEEAMARAHHRRVFLEEHVLSWLPAYLSKLGSLGSPFYRRWSDLLLSVLSREAERTEPGEVSPAHFLETRSLGEAPEELGEQLDALLSPVRSGMILTRSDLARAARRLGLAGRMGERRFMLHAMVQQDPAPIRRWLVEQAEETESLYDAAPRPLRRSLQPWRERLEITRDRLSE